ncbi:ribonuclease III [Candidatus Phytoplasma citri]|uniref:Ribonuclease 3 n=1 Tax=Candidatus Phytoplasma citri TaxID=180978 RepID=A0A1S9M1W5_9MOLU|nr:ribonuclease III [Candidatus Phytoplasma aurantifolia]MDO8060136.1 ribonuclease III [Candidatus Phytoplasma aurantifolia]MDO8078727.1 ribonuclease III [Candidatus Phytoplasma aurantifolia]MDV3166139.1 ribonuclease III ['Waltheria sp.' little leaf phytoplasma]OOP59297.1 ribonuclease III [Candidatus Phytoplasma aurantifolia]
MYLQNLFTRLNIKPKNINLYINALTHSSYANEHNLKNQNNERLEFLGDSIINFLMANYLYRKNQDNEGIMTKKRAQAVCVASLLIYSAEINLKQYILLGKGERKRGIYNYSIIADAFEALFAAIYLDLGYLQVKKTFHYIVVPCLSKVIGIIDFKTQLQELVQTRHQHIKYKIVAETGLAHEKEFIAEVYLSEQLLGKGEGKTKKSAEQQAAKIALEKLSQESKLK